MRRHPTQPVVADQSGEPVFLPNNFLVSLLERVVGEQDIWVLLDIVAANGDGIAHEDVRQVCQLLGMPVAKYMEQTFVRPQDIERVQAKLGPRNRSRASEQPN